MGISDLNLQKKGCVIFVMGQSLQFCNGIILALTISNINDGRIFFAGFNNPACACSGL
jgi:hypothetical protein